MKLADIPDSLAVIQAAFLATVLLKYWGSKVSADEHPVFDRLLDIATALAATTMITGLVSTPFVGSIAKLSRKLIDLIAEQTHGLVGATINVVTILVTIGLAIWLFVRFEKNEKKSDLAILGLVMLAAGTLFPWVNTGLKAWVNYPIALVWNIAIGAYNIIVGIQFTV